MHTPMDHCSTFPKTLPCKFNTCFYIVKYSWTTKPNVDVILQHIRFAWSLYVSKIHNFAEPSHEWDILYQSFEENAENTNYILQKIQ